LVTKKGAITIRSSSNTKRVLNNALSSWIFSLLLKRLRLSNYPKPFLFVQELQTQTQRGTTNLECKIERFCVSLEEIQKEGNFHEKNICNNSIFLYKLDNPFPAHSLQFTRLLRHHRQRGDLLLGRKKQRRRKSRKRRLLLHPARGRFYSNAEDGGCEVAVPEEQRDGTEGVCYNGPVLRSRPKKSGMTCRRCRGRKKHA